MTADPDEYAALRELAETTLTTPDASAYFTKRQHELAADLHDLLAAYDALATEHAFCEDRISDAVAEAMAGEDL